MIQTLPSGGTNCYLLRPDGGGPAVLVDAGRAEDGNFLSRLWEKVSPAHLALVILTHGHHDHVGHAGTLQRDFGIPVALHPADWDLVTQGKLTCPPGRGPMGALISRFSLRTLDRGRYTPFTPDRRLVPGPLPGFPGMEILALPGHTPGSVGVVFEDCLLVGDLVMNLPFPSLTWLAEDFPAARTSLAGLAGRSFRTIYPGHGRPIRGGWLDRHT